MLTCLSHRTFPLKPERKSPLDTWHSLASFLHGTRCAHVLGESLSGSNQRQSKNNSELSFRVICRFTGFWELHDLDQRIHIQDLGGEPIDLFQGNALDAFLSFVYEVKLSIFK